MTAVRIVLGVARRIEVMALTGMADGVPTAAVRLAAGAKRLVAWLMAELTGLENGVPRSTGAETGVGTTSGELATSLTALNTCLIDEACGTMDRACETAEARFTVGVACRIERGGVPTIALSADDGSTALLMELNTCLTEEACGTADKACETAEAKFAVGSD